MNENILLIRLKSIGDVVLTLPSVHAVREHFPAAKITFLTSRENAPLLRGFSEVDEVLAINRAVLSAGNPFKITAELFPLLRRLRAGKFSLVLDFQGYGETELLAWWSGAPERGGIAYKAGRGWMYTTTSTRNYSAHPASWNLDLLRGLGLPPVPVQNEFVLPADALAAAREFFTVHKIDPLRPTLFVQPFTSNRSKNWALEHFVEVARQWHSRGVQIIFGGGPNERDALAPACDAGFAVAAGTPLLVSAGLIKLSSVIVGADTGLLHLAVAMGRRVVMVMHASYPGTYHPFQHPDWTVIPPAGKTVVDIEINRVMTATERAFAEVSGS